MPRSNANASIMSPSGACEAICIGFTSIFFVGVAAVLFYFGATFKDATCAEPLPVWCFVAGGVLLALVLFFLMEVFLGPRCGWHGLLHQCSSSAAAGKRTLDGEDEDEEDGGRQQRSSKASATNENLFTLMSVGQVTVLVAFVTVFVYGAYAVLAIFGQQRNAIPGTEVCNRQLYDPLFFIIILFDVLLVIVLLLVVCLNCDALCCNCCGCADSDAVKKEKAARKLQGEDDAIVKERSGFYGSSAGKEDEQKGKEVGASSSDESRSFLSAERFPDGKEAGLTQRKQTSTNDKTEITTV